MNNYKQFLIIGNSEISDINFAINNGIKVPKSSFRVKHETDDKGKTGKSHSLLEMSFLQLPPAGIIDWVTGIEMYQEGVLVIFDGTDKIVFKTVFKNALCKMELTYSKDREPQAMTELTIHAKQFIVNDVLTENEFEPSYFTDINSN